MDIRGLSRLSCCCGRMNEQENRPPDEESETLFLEARSGTAPSDVRSLQVWGGPGQGAPCDLCRNEIGPGEVDYEVEAIVDGQPRALHFHIRCFELWKTGTDAA